MAAVVGSSPIARSSEKENLIRQDGILFFRFGVYGTRIERKNAN